MSVSAARNTLRYLLGLFGGAPKTLMGFFDDDGDRDLSADYAAAGLGSEALDPSLVQFDLTYPIENAVQVFFS